LKNAADEQVRDPAKTYRPSAEVKDNNETKYVKKQNIIQWKAVN